MNQLEFPLPPETIEIPLSKRGKHAGKYTAIVDFIDDDLASANWTAQSSHGNVYAHRNYYDENGKVTRVLMHRVIMERELGYPIPKGMEVDHINGIGTDNRRENLRLATNIQNSMNSKKPRTNKSGYKGVSFMAESNKWRATIKANGKLFYLGSFDTPEQAHAAYCDAADELHGDFANYGE
jgi:hypothetical protein